MRSTHTVLHYGGLARAPYEHCLVSDKPAPKIQKWWRKFLRPKYLIYLSISLLAKVVVGFLVTRYLLGAGESAQCSDGFSMFKHTGFCYKVHTDPMNFVMAGKTCLNESSHLISIHSEKENEFVRELSRTSLSEAKFISLGSTRVWLGLQLINWRWQWIDETERDYTDWVADMPNHLNKEQWASLLIDNITETGKSDKRTWRTEKSDNFLTFVCKKKP